MNLRSGKLVAYTALKSKPFDVKGRAVNPQQENILVTANKDRETLAQQYGVRVIAPADGKPAEINFAYAYEQELDATDPPHKHLLLDFGHDYLYYGISPLPLREPRANPGAPRANPVFPPPPGTDQLKIIVRYDEPATAGLTAPSRVGAMGDSARNYAVFILGERAEALNWEWLHIVGHSLGGNNEPGNLVAGSFDANTAMIPYERQLLQATQRTRLKGYPDPVEALYVVNLYPESWVAIDIQASFHGCGEWVATETFRAQTTLTFDKLQYDLRSA